MPHATPRQQKRRVGWAGQGDDGAGAPHAPHARGTLPMTPPRVLRLRGPVAWRRACICSQLACLFAEGNRTACVASPARSGQSDGPIRTRVGTIRPGPKLKCAEGAPHTAFFFTCPSTPLPPSSPHAQSSWTLGCPGHTSQRLTRLGLGQGKALPPNGATCAADDTRSRYPIRAPRHSEVGRGVRHGIGRWNGTPARQRSGRHATRAFIRFLRPRLASEDTGDDAEEVNGVPVNVHDTPLHATPPASSRHLPYQHLTTAIIYVAAADVLTVHPISLQPRRPLFSITALRH